MAATAAKQITLASRKRPSLDGLHFLVYRNVRFILILVKTEERSMTTRRLHVVPVRSADIAALTAELAETKRRLAQLTGEDTGEAAASGSSDLMIPKDKTDQFFEWLSGG